MFHSPINNNAFKNPVNGPSDDPSFQGMSHELRSTIQGLLGYLSIFNDEVGPKLDIEQAHLLERITCFANNLSDLVTDALTIVNDENSQNP